MAIKYYKLLDLINRRGIKKKDLVDSNLISSATMAKLSKNDTVNTQTIDKLCEYFDVQPGDIMEYVREDKKG